YNHCVRQLLYTLFPYTSLFRSSSTPSSSPRTFSSTDFSLVKKMKGMFRQRGSFLMVLQSENPSPPGNRVSEMMRSGAAWSRNSRSEEHTTELQSRENLVCRLLL